MKNVYVVSRRVKISVIKSYYLHLFKQFKRERHLEYKFNILL